MSLLAPRKGMSQEIIARTGFYTNLGTYLLLLLSDALRPGFVARYFSPHLFFLVTLVFGCWWVWVMKSPKDRKMFQLFGAGILAIVLSVIVWKFGEGFESYRILTFLLALGIPFALLSLIRSQTDD